MPRWSKLYGYLVTVFPDDKVLQFHVSLMAMQYMFNHPEAVDCLLAALLLRRMNGLRLVAHLHSNSPGAVAFMVTETDSWELRELTRSSGAIGYLPKPLTLELVQGVTTEFFCKSF